MRRTKISDKHLAMAQQIIDFIQSVGWDVEGLSIYRYDDTPLSIGPETKESWKGQAANIKWGLELKVAPRDEDEPPSRKSNASV